MNIKNYFKYIKESESFENEKISDPYEFEYIVKEHLYQLVEFEGWSFQYNFPIKRWKKDGELVISKIDYPSFSIYLYNSNYMPKTNILSNMVDVSWVGEVDENLNLKFEEKYIKLPKNKNYEYTEEHFEDIGNKILAIIEAISIETKQTFTFSYGSNSFDGLYLKFFGRLI